MAEEPWINDWVVERELSGGGQGATTLVHRACNPTERGVLKTLQHNDSEKARRRMRREVTNLDTVKKAGGSVPGVLDVGNVNQYEDPAVRLYFVMEYVEGQTLDKPISSSKGLAVPDAIGIVQDLCRTARIGQLEGVYHRDLKPQNIIAKIGNETVVLDYGLSFNAKDEEHTFAEPIKNSFITIPSAVVAGGNRRDPRIDLIALAGILFYCITGVEPQLLRDGNNLAPHRRNDTLKNKLGSDPHLPFLESFFDKGFAAHILSTYQSIEEFMQRLNDVLQYVAGTSVEDPVAVAFQSSQFLRDHNRQIRLDGFAGPAAKVREMIERAAQLIGQEIGKSDLYNLYNTDLGQNLGEIDGLDDLGNAGSIYVVLKFNRVFPNARAIHYRVFADRDEGVVCRKQYKQPSKKAGFGGGWDEVDGIWKPFYRYSADQIPDKVPIENDLKQQIAESIRALQSEVHTT